MTSLLRIRWFSVVAVIMVLWGAVFALFGLGILHVVDRRVLLDWESAIYGAIMIGWGVTLFLAGRIAIRRDDRELRRALRIGITVWLVVEAIRSAALGVWFNVGVDALVLALFTIPLLTSDRKTRGG